FSSQQKGWSERRFLRSWRRCTRTETPAPAPVYHAATHNTYPEYRMEVTPEDAGFSPERLDRITDHLTRNYIETGRIVGAQVAVARHGNLAYFKSFGLMDSERSKPMHDETIFRIYSMTKPITSIALMQLFE